MNSMTDKSHKKDHRKDITELDKFNLDFEFNIPWKEAKRTTQLRVTK